MNWTACGQFMVHLIALEASLVKQETQCVSPPHLTMSWPDLGLWFAPMPKPPGFHAEMHADHSTHDL